MRRREFINTVATIGAVSLLAPQSLPAFADFVEGFWIERKRPLMGTFVSIAVYLDDRAVAEKLIDECFSYMERDIATISEWNSSSIVFKLNTGEPYRLGENSELVRQLMRAILRGADASKGTYLCLPGALTEMWRQAKRQSSIPTKRDVVDALKRVRASAISVSDDCLRIKGQSSIDTGGVGEGLIANRGCNFLQRRGVRFARIDCGGDLSLLGDTAWEIRVEDPRNELPLGYLSLAGNMAVSTSGDYRNYWLVNGKRYHHLIDPVTGFPSRHAQQVTVIHPDAALADALATGLCSIPASSAIDILEKLPMAHGLIVDRNHQIHITRGLQFSLEI